MTTIVDTRSADFQMVNHGSVVSFTPLNVDARTFVDRELEIEGWQWMADSFSVDHRSALQLCEVLVDAGFSIQ
jgi:hypothetical protein